MVADCLVNSAANFVCGQDQPDAASRYSQSSWLSSFGCWSSIQTAEVFTSLLVVGPDSTATTALTQSSGIVGAFAIQIQTALADASVATAVIRPSPTNPRVSQLRGLVV